MVIYYFVHKVGQYNIISPCGGIKIVMDGVFTIFNKIVMDGVFTIFNDVWR